ncbi:MAG: hypothetical protein II931_00795 [Clostridia bacterium]|nr:hypothetical protein [Clostridia bacterium]MBQ9354455.1 hypothetical protein [Clostridia bacterium]
MENNRSAVVRMKENLFEYINDLQEKGYRIIPLFPKMEDVEYTCFAFESMQKTNGFADAINYDVTIKNGIPQTSRIEAGAKLEYVHITIKDAASDDLFIDNCAKLRAYSRRAGVDEFYRFAYIDGDNNLHLVFNKCDVHGNEFSDEDSRAIINCFA